MSKAILAVLGAAFLLSACSARLSPELDALEAMAAAKRQVILARLEDRRCKRPLHWVTDLAAERGEAWLVGYLHSCPELRALILRLIGLEARDRGLFPPP